MYVCMYSSDLEIFSGKTGPVVCEDWCSWAMLMLVCLLQGQWLHLSCFFPDDLFLKMTVLGCAVTSVSRGLKEFLVLNLQISGCLQSLV